MDLIKQIRTETLVINVLATTHLDCNFLDDRVRCKVKRRRRREIRDGEEGYQVERDREREREGAGRVGGWGCEI